MVTLSFAALIHSASMRATRQIGSAWVVVGCLWDCDANAGLRWTRETCQKSLDAIPADLFELGASATGHGDCQPLRGKLNLSKMHSMMGLICFDHSLENLTWNLMVLHLFHWLFWSHPPCQPCCHVLHIWLNPQVHVTCFWNKQLQTIFHKTLLNQICKFFHWRLNKLSSWNLKALDSLWAMFCKPLKMIFFEFPKLWILTHPFLNSALIAACSLSTFEQALQLKIEGHEMCRLCCLQHPENEENSFWVSKIQPFLTETVSVLQVEGSKSWCWSQTLKKGALRKGATMQQLHTFTSFEFWLSFWKPCDAFADQTHLTWLTFWTSCLVLTTVTSAASNQKKTRTFIGWAVKLFFRHSHCQSLQFRFSLPQRTIRLMLQVCEQGTPICFAHGSIDSQNWFMTSVHKFSDCCTKGLQKNQPVKSQQMWTVVFLKRVHEQKVFTRKRFTNLQVTNIVLRHKLCFFQKWNHKWKMVHDCEPFLQQC